MRILKMDKFPEYISPSNFDSFPNINFQKDLEYVRLEVVNFILSRKSENEYYDMMNLVKNNNTSFEDLRKISKQIKEELIEMGWKAEVVHDTSLFVYDQKKPLFLENSIEY